MFIMVHYIFYYIYYFTSTSTILVDWKKGLLRSDPPRVFKEVFAFSSMIKILFWTKVLQAMTGPGPTVWFPHGINILPRFLSSDWFSVWDAFAYLRDEYEPSPCLCRVNKSLRSPSFTKSKKQRTAGWRRDPRNRPQCDNDRLLFFSSDNWF